MSLINQTARVLRANETCKRRGIRQSEIAQVLGASQPQVSRILSGKGVRGSRLTEEVCLYVERLDVGVTADAVRQHDELIESLRATWDGSNAHAKALSTVIRSLAALHGNPGKHEGGGEVPP
jgi:predicted transcriptional regulator